MNEVALISIHAYRRDYYNSLNDCSYKKWILWGFFYLMPKYELEKLGIYGMVIPVRVW